MRRRNSGTFSWARATTACSRPSWSRSSSRRGRKSGALAGWKPPGASFHCVFIVFSGGYAVRAFSRPSWNGFSFTAWRCGGRAAFTASSQSASGSSRWRESAPRSATLRLFRFGSVFSSTKSGGMRTPPALSSGRVTSTSEGASTTRKSASPGGIMGESTALPKRTSEVTDPPRWLIPWTSAFFTSWPARKATSARMSDALMAPCPPSPATMTFVTSRIGGSGAGSARVVGRLLELADVGGGEDARAARHDHGQLRLREPVDEQLLEPGRIGDGVDDVHVLHADRAAEPLDRHPAGLLVLEGAAGPRVLLLAGHRGRPVVEHDEDVAGRGRVVDHLDEAVHAGVDEGRVADDRDDPLRVLLREHVAQAEADAERGAHGDAGIHALVRRQDTERVAADVTRDDAVVLAERAVNRVVRARLAEHGRLAFRQDRLGRGVPRHDATHAIDVELAEAEGLRLRLDGDARGADEVGEERISLLDDEAALDRGGEGADLLERERVDGLELEEARAGGGLARVERRDAGGDDPELAVARDADVERRRLGEGLELLELPAELAVRRAGVGRNHDAPDDVALEGGGLRGDRRAAGHDRLPVADAGRHAQEHRQLEPLGELERREREVVGLLRVGRLEHRERRRDGVVPVVLLVLRGGHPGIVRGDDDERAGDAGVRGGEERVGRDVHADVLHRHERPRAAVGRAEPDLERDLLVRGPLRPPAEPREVLEDLGGGGAGVDRPEVHTAVERRGGDRFVAREKTSFHRAAGLHARVPLPAARPKG